MPMVIKFLDVLSESGLPTNRELEFRIELLSGSMSVSIPLYRMVPTKLKKLKIQLQDLVDKGFIRPSVSL